MRNATHSTKGEPELQGYVQRPASLRLRLFGSQSLHLSLPCSLKQKHRFPSRRGDGLTLFSSGVKRMRNVECMPGATLLHTSLGLMTLK